MRKLLVTGISSHLGWEILRIKQKKWKISGTYNQNKVTKNQEHSFLLNLNENNALAKLFFEVKPDACIHLAALTNTSFCENNHAMSEEINVNATLRITKLCEQYQIPMIFTSTDLVFSGNEAPYSESFSPNPICVYGKHKAQAEKVVQNYEYGMVCRLPLMLGNIPHKSNFIYNCVSQIQNRQEVCFFTDEFRTPTGTRSVAKILLQLLDNFVPTVYHLGGDEKISRYELGLRICKEMNLDQNYIIKGKQQDVRMPFQRPKDVSLANTKIKEQGYRFFSLCEEIRYITESIKI